MKDRAFEISDLEGYLFHLKKSMWDKLFFVDKIFDPIQAVVDYGCANGELIKALRSLFGQHRYIGYDPNPAMIRAAQANVPGAEFYKNWDEFSVSDECALLNISSTIHEVYSYSTEKEIALFWKRVFHSGFQYITIRDMMLSEKHYTPAKITDIELLRNNVEYVKHLKDYESVWGVITEQNDLVHFLLKYRYMQNWERELRENYIPLTLDNFLKRIPNNYRMTYFDHYTLPYIAWQVREDFGIELDTPTHIKLILKKL